MKIYQFRNQNDVVHTHNTNYFSTAVADIYGFNDKYIVKDQIMKS